MSGMKKIWLIIAGVCLLVGSITALSAAAIKGFSLSSFNTDHFEEKTYTVAEAFENLDLHTVEEDIIFTVSDDDTCKIVCRENDTLTYEIAVRGNTLSITRKDSKKWFQHIGIFWGSFDTDITVYLPKTQYNQITAASVSGNISLPANFTFEKADIKTTSGNIACNAAMLQDFQAASVSGDMKIDGASKGSINFKTTSGDIELSNAVPQTLSVTSVSGDISLDRILAQNSITIHSTSGEITLNRCDGNALKFKTISGDVSGSLISDKHFITHSVSGEISVPNNTSLSETCEISTTSGDIDFIILP